MVQLLSDLRRLFGWIDRVPVKVVAEMKNRTQKLERRRDGSRRKVDRDVDRAERILKMRRKKLSGCFRKWAA
jgi:hypothetical protein